MWDLETPLSITLAVIHVTNICVTEEKVAFERLSECAQGYHTTYAQTAVSEIPGVQAARRLFRAIGIDPTKRRPSSEALLQRALKGKALYSVNSLVDTANWCSLDFLLPTCAYDAAKIVGNVTIRKGKAGETYLALNHQEINLFNRYVLADDDGAFSSPITDSQRTAITLQTQQAFLDIWAPQDYDHHLLQQQANVFAERVKMICGGEVQSIKVLGEANTSC